MFEDLNLEGWVFRVEHFFTINRLSELQKLEATTISMDGKALGWFQWENGRQPTCSWSKLKLNLLDRFQLSREGSICEKFLVLRQEHTVREYRQLFEVLSTPLTNIPEHVLESTFINRLKPKVKAEV